MHRTTLDCYPSPSEHRGRLRPRGSRSQGESEAKVGRPAISDSQPGSFKQGYSVLVGGKLGCHIRAGSGLLQGVHLGVRAKGEWRLFCMKKSEEEEEPAICLSKIPTNKLGGREAHTAHYPGSGGQM